MKVSVMTGVTPLITSILLRWKALRFGCLHKKQYFRTLRTRGITWLTVGLTGLREVTHALFLFSSLFAFSRATFFNGRDSVMLFQSFLYAFRRGAGFCSLWRGFRNSEVSAGRHSTVFRNLKETRQSSYIENILAPRIEWRQASAHTEVLEIDKLY